MGEIHIFNGPAGSGKTYTATKMGCTERAICETYLYRLGVTAEVLESPDGKTRVYECNNPESAKKLLEDNPGAKLTTFA